MPHLALSLLLAIGAGPARAQAVASPAPPGWRVGVGTRNSFAEAGSVEGVRLVAARTWGALAVEAEAYGAAGTDRVRPVTAAALEVVSQGADPPTIPEELDRATVALRAQWSLVAPERRPPDGGGARFDGGPSLFLGPELRQVQVLAVTWDGEQAATTPDSRTWQPGAQAGLALDLRIGGVAGLRLGLAERVRHQRFASDSAFATWENGLAWDTVAALDLLVDL